MKIGKYEVTSDSLNIILSKVYLAERGKLKGQHYSQPIGYYANIKELLKALADREIKDTNFEDLKKVSAKVDELYAMIESLPTAKPFQSVKKEVVIDAK